MDAFLVWVNEVDKTEEERDLGNGENICLVLDMLYLNCDQGTR